MTTITFICLFSALAMFACWKLKFPPLLLLLALPLTALATDLVFTGSTFISAYDTELWNGSISEKPHLVQECPSGWQDSEDDFCTEYTTQEHDDGQVCSGSGKNRTCSEQYHTQYKYDYSWEGKWYLKSADIGKTWYIERVDAQGALTPPEWARVKVGDPASATNGYPNWVQAASDSLFAEDGSSLDKYKALIPPYPITLHDYINVDRILTAGVMVSIEDLSRYNVMLSRALIQLGPKRQMNAVIVLIDASKANRDYAYAVRRAWKGFKKNDAVIFIGLQGSTINWAEVLSWSKNSLFNIELRDAIQDDAGKPLDMTKVIQSLSTIGMADYQRRAMAEFEYLKADIPISTAAYFIAAFINLFILTVVVIGWSYYKEKRYGRRRYIY